MAPEQKEQENTYYNHGFCYMFFEIIGSMDGSPSACTEAEDKQNYGGEIFQTSSYYYCLHTLISEHL